MATTHERFVKVMHHGDLSDGFPVIEWAFWWDLTAERWKSEGMPEGMDLHESHDYFGLDRHYMYGVGTPYGPEYKEAQKREKIGRITNEDDYDKMRPYMFPEPKIADMSRVEMMVKHQEEGKAFLWMNFNGAFWFPRILLGIEPHLFAFYEQPRLMKRMIEDLTEHNLRSMELGLQYYKPDLVPVSEDMSYNHGVMVSDDVFEEFIAPFYRAFAGLANKNDLIMIVDSDGDVTNLIPLMKACGVKGILPLERMAGVDVCQIRRDHPEWRMLGGYDKTTMHLGEDGIRAELERIRPAVLGGRFIPSCDHQTPPGVSFEDYKLYARLLREFSEDVAKEYRAMQRKAPAEEMAE